MQPDDPRRLYLLLTALACLFSALCAAAPIAAWGLRWKRRAVDMEIRLRACMLRQERETEAREAIGLGAQELARTLRSLRRGR